MSIRRVVPLLLVFVPVVLLFPTGAQSQAWLPKKGEIFLSTSYQFLSSDRHLVSSSIVNGVDQGTRSLDRGSVQSQVLLLDVDFGVTDRLAVSGAVAVVNARYVEGGTHGPNDDGDWHGGFQDGRIGARFMAVNDGSWVLTPSINYGFPTANYVTLGHAALGRNLNELRLGLDWGKLLASRAYVQGNYSYAFMENAEDVSLDRSNLSVELGYFLNKYVTLQAWTDYQNIHGGLDWATDLDRHDEHFVELFPDHDRTAASDFVRVGAGVSVPVNDVDFYVNVAKTAWGINTHNALTVSFGMSWGFEMFGKRDLGIWEQREEEDSDSEADMDDWLLEAIDDVDGEQQAEKDPSSADGNGKEKRKNRDGKSS